MLENFSGGGRPEPAGLLPSPRLSELLPGEVTGAEPPAGRGTAPGTVSSAYTVSRRSLQHLPYFSSALQRASPLGAGRAHPASSADSYDPISTGRIAAL